MVKRLNVESLLEEDLEKGKVADHLEGRISIENLYFSYNAEEPVLEA